MSLPLTIEHALLGFLQHQPMHAYELHQRIEHTEELGFIWHVKQGNLYALLAKLEMAGYISTALEPQGTRPPRKILSLTPAGEQALDRWLSTPVAHGREFRVDFLAKLYIASQRNLSSATQLIALQRTASLTKLAELRAQASELGDTKRYSWLVIQFRITNLEAILQWLDMCATSLSSSREPGP